MKKRKEAKPLEREGRDRPAPHIGYITNSKITYLTIL